jgi:predicted ATP-dependent endonuclease of OLD family
VDQFRQSVFSELVSAAIHSLSKSKQRVDQVERFYSDVVKRIGRVEADLTSELKPYLPDIKTVKIVLSELDLLRLVRVTDVHVDDGALTSLSQKGDGFKSVFAMSILQYIAKQRSGRKLIFAIEEPESHLHSSAIYEVKSSLEALSKSFQTLITTHSPVLIQREHLASNVIIGQTQGTSFSSTASAAGSLAQIRESLGIKLQDNMTSAEVVLIVEGATEETCLGRVLSQMSKTTGDAFTTGRVRIINSGGASKMAAVLRALARDVVPCIALTDADTSGDKAKSDLLASGLISSTDVFSVPSRAGCVETEFEDAFPPNLWINELSTACGIVAHEADYTLAQQKSGSTRTKMKKWSEVMSELCAKHGKTWADIEAVAKSAFATAITSNAKALQPADFPWAQSLAARIDHHLSRS